MQREPNTEYILSLSYGKDSIACLEAIKQLGYPLDRIVHAEVWATDNIPADLPPMVEFKKYADKVIKEMYDIDVEHICATRGANLPTTSISTQRKHTESGLKKSTDSLSQSERGVTTSKTELSQPILEKVTYEKLFYHIPNRGKPRERERETGGNVTEQVAEQTANSKWRHSDKSILGFPIPKGTWCNSGLKKAALRISNLNQQRELVYTTQKAGFQKPPLHKAGRKILCSILE